MRLKYGCNPHQSYAALEPLDGGKLPVELLNGTPSLINFLDALNAWQLVSEAREALGPARGGELQARLARRRGGRGAAARRPGARLRGEGRRRSRPAATAYVRARGADPKCSFGDIVALSDVGRRGDRASS